MGVWYVGCCGVLPHLGQVCPNLQMKVHKRNGDLLRKSVWLQWGSCSKHEYEEDQEA